MQLCVHVCVYAWCACLLLCVPRVVGFGGMAFCAGRRGDDDVGGGMDGRGRRRLGSAMRGVGTGQTIPTSIIVENQVLLFSYYQHSLLVPVWSQDNAICTSVRVHVRRYHGTGTYVTVQVYVHVYYHGTRVPWCNTNHTGIAW